MDSDNKKITYSRCTSFCTANGYDLVAIASFFKKKSYLTRISRDLLQVTNAKRSGHIFFFNHGCFVTWGFKKSFEEKVLEDVRQFASEPLAEIEVDHFNYHYGDKMAIHTDERTHLDTITLATDDHKKKLAISYALAQSIKLESFEESIQQAIQKYNYIPGEIATKGAISLSQKAIFKRMGEIFLARSSINLNIEFLDVPEFFWSHPNLEPPYEMVKNFLDIPSRVQALNQKLDVLQELLDILNSQVQHRHSSFLEGIIILLIGLEIIITLFNIHMA